LNSSELVSTSDLMVEMADAWCGGVNVATDRLVVLCREGD